MAVLTSTLIAAAALTVSAIGVYNGIQGRKDAAAAYQSQAEEGKKIQSEQKALNAQAQANEKRAQIREERVRRGKIMQASENTGAGGSSSEFGAISSLSTQLETNLGINASRAEAGNRIGGYAQNAADFGTAAQRASLSAQNGDSLFSMSQSIFGSAGGFNALGVK